MEGDKNNSNWQQRVDRLTEAFKYYGVRKHTGIMDRKKMEERKIQERRGEEKKK